jgi:hypothetical protein
VWIAWAIAIIATALGFTAGWIAAFDLINEARPVQVAGALALFAAAIALREPPLIRPTAALALLQVGLVLLPWARAADSAPSAPPALRLVTFYLGTDNDRLDEVADFLLAASADVVLLQDVSCTAADRLIPKLKTAFPTALVSTDTCAGQALLSKRPWLAGGQVIFTLTGLRLSDPIAPNEQAADMARLLAHVASQGASHVVAGTFATTPFAWKFAQLQNAGLGQHATYLATFPAQLPLALPTTCCRPRTSPACASASGRRSAPRIVR